MAINYDKLLSKLEPGKWYTGKELDVLWRETSSKRKTRVNTMVEAKMLLRRGKTTKTQYALSNIALMGKETVKEKPPTTLDELIKAASKVGTENEIMRKALQDAKTLIDKALESTK